MESDRLQRLGQRKGFQTDVQTVANVVDYEIDAASESAILSVRLRQRGEAITEFVVSAAEDRLGIPALSGGESQRDEYGIERGRNGAREIHARIVSGTTGPRTTCGMSGLLASAVGDVVDPMCAPSPPRQWGSSADGPLETRCSRGRDVALLRDAPVGPGA